jgi:hypothetical protein
MSYNPAYSNKNNSPQHYQSFNRWFRWHYGACADGKLQLVSRDSGENVATIIGVWAILLEEASDLNHWGIAIDDHQYHAVILGLDLDTVVKIVGGFISLRMVEPCKEGIRILNWHKRQYYTDARDPTHIERKARWLKLKAGTERNAQERSGTPETETDTDTDTDKKVSKLLGVANKNKNKTGTRLPDNWEPSPTNLEFAARLLGGAAATAELPKFRDYWGSVPGQRGLKLDWDKTWRNWCRIAHERKGNGNGTKPQSARERWGDLLQSARSGNLRQHLTGRLPDKPTNGPDRVFDLSDGDFHEVPVRGGQEGR